MFACIKQTEWQRQSGYFARSVVSRSPSQIWCIRNKRSVLRRRSRDTYRNIRTCFEKDVFKTFAICNHRKSGWKYIIRSRLIDNLVGVIIIDINEVNATDKKSSRLGLRQEVLSATIIVAWTIICSCFWPWNRRDYEILESLIIELEKSWLLCCKFRVDLSFLL